MSRVYGENEQLVEESMRVCLEYYATDDEIAASAKSEIPSKKVPS